MVIERFIASLLLLATAGAAQAQDGIATLVIDGASVFSIEPGGEGRLAFDVDAFRGGTFVAGGPLAAGTDAGEYDFVPEAGSDCAAPVVQADRIEFAVGFLPTGAVARCRYRVTRRADSRHDLAFALCTLARACFDTVLFGTRPDVGIAVEPTDVLNVMRVTVTNASPHDVTRAVFTTLCLRADAASPYAAGIALRNDLPEGCELASAEGLCRSGDEASAFALGPIPVGGSASCLVRIESLGRDVIDDRYGDALLLNGPDLFDVPVELARGGSGYDANPSNDHAHFRFSFGMVSGIPAGGYAATATLALLLLVLARRRLRAA